jgi:uncharacterized protein YdhG (YjbR/CyaY superfamily)/predicted DNA-binding protein (MmcQ/YjbR family)
MTSDLFHDRLLAITLGLPGAYEDRPWGSVHCKVDEKIFVGWGRLPDGDMSVGLRVDKGAQLMLVADDPRFTIAKYVGKHGGVDMRLGPDPDWDEVESFIVESYRIIAKKSRVAELDAMSARPKRLPRSASTRSKAKSKPKPTGASPRAKKSPVDDYLATVTPAQRVLLDELRRTIRSAVPDAVECISYRMPAFRFDGRIIAGFSATSKGCSYYPFSGATLKTLAGALGAYTRTKSALHFGPDRPLPASLVRKLLAARIAEGKRRKTPS